MVNPVNINLSTARTSAIQGMQKQEVKVVEAAKNIQNSFSRGGEKVSDTVKPRETAPVQDTVELSPEAAVAQQNEASVVESMVDMKQASTAYLANLKALDAVNDLEKESVDMLR